MLRLCSGHLLLDDKHRLQEHITSRLQAYACGFTSHFESEIARLSLQKKSEIARTHFESEIPHLRLFGP